MSLFSKMVECSFKRENLKSVMKVSLFNLINIILYASTAFKKIYTFLDLKYTKSAPLDNINHSDYPLKLLSYKKKKKTLNT